MSATSILQSFTQPVDIWKYNKTKTEAYSEDNIQPKNELMTITDYNNEKMYVDAIKEILEYKYLKENWDSYNAKPIGEVVILKSINFLNEVKDIFNTNNIIISEIVATPLQDGSLSQEYSNNNKCITVIFDNYKNIVLREIDNEITEDYELSNTKESMEEEFLWLAS